jgi:hypothetical protein
MIFPLNQTVSIYQHKRTGNTESYQDSPTYEGVEALVSPTGTDIQADYGGVASFQLFEIFLYDMSLTLGNADKIVTASGTEYIVDGQPYLIDNPFLKYIRCLAKQKV